MKISIITVCLNAENSIQKTIESVISQPVKELEYLIIDGKSTDRTIELIGQYKNKISRLVCEEDNGVYDAFNKGIKLASGDIVGILNAGDWYEPNILNTVLDFFEKNPPIEMLHGDLRIFGKDGNVVMDFKPDLSLNAWWHGMPVNHPACFIRRRVYSRLGLYKLNYKISADYEFIVRLIKSKIPQYYLPLVLTNFPYGGLSGNLFERLKEDAKIIFIYRRSGIAALMYFVTHFVRGIIKFVIDALGFNLILRIYRLSSNRKVLT